MYQTPANERLTLKLSMSERRLADCILALISAPASSVPSCIITWSTDIKIGFMMK